MQIHHYDPQTKQYMGVSEARPDPEELCLAQDKAGQSAADAVVPDKGKSKNDFDAAQASAYTDAAAAVHPTIFLIPANATIIAPPEVESGQAACFTGTGWDVIDLPKPPPPPPSPDLMTILRQRRNRLLEQSDRMVLPDRPWTDAQRAAWGTYRQALRDLPATTKDATKTAWPTPPIPLA